MQNVQPHVAVFRQDLPMKYPTINGGVITFNKEGRFILTESLDAIEGVASILAQYGIFQEGELISSATLLPVRDVLAEDGVDFGQGDDLTIEGEIQVLRIKPEGPVIEESDEDLLKPVSTENNFDPFKDNTDETVLTNPLSGATQAADPFADKTITATPPTVVTKPNDAKGGGKRSKTPAGDSERSSGLVTAPADEDDGFRS